ncbi:NUDIX domain-containing protein [Pontibacter silvestris]|uniref:NUDIX domain-containing protein n=1 Tax=Pontibacter silvestris TaxID=2305183 RepID=A0ABW4WV54_9BACT|nr:NUDIX hydrolase [Pontibacter silvestris]MCC9136899.1 NUDIX hydrolase [Pontibacter silvestris]
MNNLNPNAAGYAHKLRVRVCGICIKNNKLLLVQHQQTVNNTAFWAPPGGGLNYGESIKDCLKREFLEETRLEIDVSRFLFLNEFMEEPLHAVEMFFEVRTKGERVATGFDPELPPDNQLIEHVQYLTLDEIRKIERQNKHHILHHLFSLDDLLGLDNNFLP